MYCQVFDWYYSYYSFKYWYDCVWGIDVNGVIKRDFVVVYVVEFFSYISNFGC